MKCEHGYSRKAICPKCLEPRNLEMFILRSRGWTYKQIGNEYGVSLERARQITYKQRQVQYKKILKTFQQFVSISKRLRAVRNNAELLPVQIWGDT